MQSILLDSVRLVPYTVANGRQAISHVGMVLLFVCSVRCRSVLLQSGLHLLKSSFPAVHEGRQCSAGVIALLRFGSSGVFATAVREHATAVRERRVDSGGGFDDCEWAGPFRHDMFCFSLRHGRLDEVASETGRIDARHVPVT